MGLYTTSNILNIVLFVFSILLFLTSVFSYLYQQRKLKRRQVQLNIELEHRTNEIQRQITNLESSSSKPAVAF